MNGKFNASCRLRRAARVPAVVSCKAAARQMAMFFATESEQLAALTVRHAVPAIQQSRDFSIAGGLLSYGGKFVSRSGKLKGKKPADLPVDVRCPSEGDGDKRMRNFAQGEAARYAGPRGPYPLKRKASAPLRRSAS